MEQSRNKPSDTEAQNRMEYRTITAPVLIPERPDCDYTKGEPPLTQEQIQKFKNSYDNYQIIDYDHEFTDSDSPWYMRPLGKPVRSWITTEPTTYTNVAGKTESIPAGSWWLTSHVTDKGAIRLIDEVLLTAYSITVGNRAYCDKFMKQWQTANKADTGDDLILTTELLAGKRKTLIKDIVDPVGFTVSLTGLPCVGSAMFSRDCLAKSQDSTGGAVANKKNIGGEKMPEETNNETRFSIRELLGLKEFFANKSDEETPAKEEEEEETPKAEDEKPKNDYVTREELNQKFDDFKGEIVDIFDEKLEKVVEKLTVKKEEPEPEKEEEGKAEEEEDKTADKHAPTPSSQLDNTDDGYNQNTSNKNNKSTKAKMMKTLNRKPNGDYKFPRNY